MRKRRAAYTIKYLSLGFAIAIYALLFLPEPAQAMHIAEGILPFNWAAIWYAVAVVFVGFGIYFINKKTRDDRRIIPLLGLTGAAIFIISCLPIPVPVAGTCSHPCGTPLGAILVGPFVSTVLGALALLLQALFLAHGGFTTWGANIVSMAVAGSFVGFGVFILLRKFNVPLFLAAFTAGMLGDWATYATTAFELASGLSAEGTLWTTFTTILAAFVPTQVPLGILEGLFTGGVVSLLYQRRPELFPAIFANRRPEQTMVKGETI